MENDISEKMNNLRDEVDLKAESIKIEIDTQRDLLFGKLDSLQQEMNKLGYS